MWLKDHMELYFWSCLSDVILQHYITAEQEQMSIYSDLCYIQCFIFISWRTHGWVVKALDPRSRGLWLNSHNADYAEKKPWTTFESVHQVLISWLDRGDVDSKLDGQLLHHKHKTSLRKAVCGLHLAHLYLGAISLKF